MWPLVNYQPEKRGFSLRLPKLEQICRQKSRYRDAYSGARGMHRGYLVAVLLCTCQALAWADPLCARDENAAAAASKPKPARERPAQADPVIDRIRSKLTDPGLRGDADAADLAALEAFYGSSGAVPLWITDMGLSAKGQRALFEIEKADDWGLDATAFELPPAGDLPAGPDEQAIAEIKLDLAILKYARFARGRAPEPARAQQLVRPGSSFARSEDRLDGDRRRKERQIPIFSPCIPSTSSSDACARLS